MNKNKRNLYIFLAISVVVSLVMLEWRPWVSLTTSSVLQPELKSDAASGVVRQAQASNAITILPENSEPLKQQIIRAQLSPIQFTTIVSEINGKVLQVPVREGEGFSEKEWLVYFDCALQEAQLEKVKAQMQIAVRKYDTNLKLLSRGSVSKIETDNAASERDRASAEVKELTILVSKCKIGAPYKGKVVEQKVRAQQFVQVGQPLMEILDNSLMELEFIAPSQWISSIQVGHQFQIAIDETNKKYPARITRIGAKIDPVSQTVKLAAVIDGEFPELSPGMSGTIAISTTSEKL